MLLVEPRHAAESCHTFPLEVSDCATHPTSWEHVEYYPLVAFRLMWAIMWRCGLVCCLQCKHIYSNIRQPMSSLHHCSPLSTSFTTYRKTFQVVCLVYILTEPGTSFILTDSDVKLLFSIEPAKRYVFTHKGVQHRSQSLTLTISVILLF